MSVMDRVEKVNATTYFVYAKPVDMGNYAKKIGVVNYPGSGVQPDKSKRYQACFNRKEIDHYDSVEEAATAILTDYRRNRK